MGYCSRCRLSLALGKIKIKKKYKKNVCAEGSEAVRLWYQKVEWIGGLALVCATDALQYGPLEDNVMPFGLRGSL